VGEGQGGLIHFKQNFLARNTLFWMRRERNTACAPTALLIRHNEALAGGKKTKFRQKL
jgi:hypothetical protein